MHNLFGFMINNFYENKKKFFTKLYIVNMRHFISEEMKLF